MERVFRSLKSEWIPPFGYLSIPDARTGIGDHLMDYHNRQRPYTFDGSKRPVAEEDKLKYRPELVDHYRTSDT